MGQAQIYKNSVFWEIVLLEIHSKNYMLNFFHAKYLLKYSFLIMQQFNFIIFLFFKLFFNMVVKTKFHASWQCVLSLSSFQFHSFFSFSAPARACACVLVISTFVCTSYMCVKASMYYFSVCAAWKWSGIVTRVAIATNSL